MGTIRDPHPQPQRAFWRLTGGPPDFTSTTREDSTKCASNQIGLDAGCHGSSGPGARGHAHGVGFRRRESDHQRVSCPRPQRRATTNSSRFTTTAAPTTPSPRFRAPATPSPRRTASTRCTHPERHRHSGPRPLAVREQRAATRSRAYPSGSGNATGDAHLHDRHSGQRRASRCSTTTPAAAASSSRTGSMRWARRARRIRSTRKAPAIRR